MKIVYKIDPKESILSYFKIRQTQQYVIWMIHPYQVSCTL